MAGKNMAVFGIYSNRIAAEEALGHLRSAGFRGTDGSVLVPENQGTKDLAHEKNTKAPEGFTAGAITGGVLGGVFGWLLSAGILVIPALTPYLGSGPIVATLAGLGAVGVLGAIVGMLVGVGIPEYEARRYEGRIREGGVLLSVHCDNHDWVKRAKNVLEDTGAQDIGAAGEKSGDFANGDKPGLRVRPIADASTVPVNTVPVTAPVSAVPVTVPVSTVPVSTVPVSAVPVTTVPVEPVYGGGSRPLPRVRSTAADNVVTGDELYTERVVRRRVVQDPQSFE